jgi:hypothetical protein
MTSDIRNCGIRHMQAASNIKSVRAAHQERLAALQKKLEMYQKQLQLQGDPGAPAIWYAFAFQRPTVIWMETSQTQPCRRQSS